MMSEIAMSVLDVAENSVRAKATWVRIEVLVDEAADSLIVSIEDNGCGMSEEQVRKVSDPFFTTRTTRKVGLGVPFFKEACECTGGDFTIESKEGVGTKFTARFVLSHIDRIPLGDINGSIHQLVTFREEINWIIENTSMYAKRALLGEIKKDEATATAIYNRIFYGVGALAG